MYESRSSVWILVLAALIALAVVGFFIIVPISDGATQRAQYSLQTTQAGENGQTERATQEQQTQRHTADLRAEGSARITDYTALLLSAGGAVVAVMLAAGVVGCGLNWLDNQQTRRTLLILEAQRQAAQMQWRTQLYLPREFTEAKEREIVVVGREKT